MNRKIINRDIESLITDHLDIWKEFDQKTVFITGGTGFIGSFIVNFFMRLAENYRISTKLILLVQNSDNAKERLGDSYNKERITFIEKNIVEPFSIDSDVDYVIHAASKANPGAYMADPVGTVMININGTANVLNSLREKSVRNVVYLSTIEAYGQHNHTDKITEEVVGMIDPKNIRGCYPLSKSCAENLCFCYSEQYDTPVSVARLSYIYGAGDNINDPKVVTAFLNDIKNGRNIVLKSDGTQKRTYCYIKDAVFGILLTLLRGENKQIYNISSLESTITIKGIAELILELFGNDKQRIERIKPSTSEEKRFSIMQNNILDNSKIKQLGFQESVNMHSGLLATGKYFDLNPRSGVK